MERPTEISENREVFWNDYKKRGIKVVIKKYRGDSFKMKVKSKLCKIFWGGEIIYKYLITNSYEWGVI